MEMKTKNDVAEYLLENYNHIPLCASIANKMKNNQEITLSERNKIHELFNSYSRGFREAIREHERYGKSSKANFKAANDLQTVNLEDTSLLSKIIS